MDAVGSTGLLVAAIRAEESGRSDRLFSDPFADALAGAAGQAALRRYRTASGAAVPIIEVRTRWYDDALHSVLGSGIAQCVIVAAGMDTRAFRLAWPQGARVFEVDRPQVIAWKESALAGATTRASTRVTIGADLSEDWGERLLNSPPMASTLQMMREFGAPWIFGTDTPEMLLPNWAVHTDDIAEVGNRLGRWPFTAAPRNMPDVPRGYLVTATRR